MMRQGFFGGGGVVTRRELVAYVKDVLGCSRDTALKAVNAVFDGVVKGLQKDKKVQLLGFGTFTVHHRKARKGRNPRTGQEIRIKATKTVTFRPSKVLRGSLK